MTYLAFRPASFIKIMHFKLIIDRADGGCIYVIVHQQLET